MRKGDTARAAVCFLLLWAVFSGLLWGMSAGAAAGAGRDSGAGTDAGDVPRGPQGKDAAALDPLIGGDGRGKAGKETAPEETGEPITLSAETLSSEDPLPERKEILVYLSETGETVRMDLEDYVAGAVTAEMPLSFGTEALKAQATAIRTAVIYQSVTGRSHGDSAACVCDDYRHCMAYLPPEEAEERFGAVYTEEIRAAVRATEGLILTYDGAPVAAMFHASSRGRTESAEDVFGWAAPCLVPVATGEADRVTETFLTLDTLREIFGVSDGVPFRGITVTPDAAGRAGKVTAFGQVGS